MWGTIWYLRMGNMPSPGIRGIEVACREYLCIVFGLQYAAHQRARIWQSATRGGQHVHAERERERAARAQAAAHAALVHIPRLHTAQGPCRTMHR